MLLRTTFLILFYSVTPSIAALRSSSRLLSSTANRSSTNRSGSVYHTSSATRISVRIFHLPGLGRAADAVAVRLIPVRSIEWHC
jgi:hypothetical protein